MLPRVEKTKKKKRDTKRFTTGSSKIDNRFTTGFTTPCKTEPFEYEKQDEERVKIVHEHVEKQKCTLNLISTFEEEIIVNENDIEENIEIQKKKREVIVFCSDDELVIKDCPDSKKIKTDEYDKKTERLKHYNSLQQIRRKRNKKNPYKRWEDYFERYGLKYPFHLETKK